MNVKTKQFYLLSVLLLLLPLLLITIKPTVGEAAAEGTQQVTLKKLVFDTLPTERKNTGDMMQWDNSAPLSGAGFTAYDITADYWTIYDQTAGNKEAKELAAIAAVKALNITGKTTFIFPNTNASGDATLSLPVVSNGKNAVYLFKETTTPSGTNAEKSVPFVLGLPVINADGTNKSTVYLYPKNEYKPTNLSFIKYGVGLNSSGDNDEPKPLSGAQFVLKEKDGSYYNTISGKFDASLANASKFTSGSNGSVTAANLILKTPATYEFYEVESNVATNAGQSAADPEKYHYSKNPAVVAKTQRDPQTSILSVSYDYFDKDLTQQLGKSSASAYNFLVPQPKKTTDIADADIGQIITYTLTQQIPLDIKQYTSFGFVDTPSTSLALISTDQEISSSIKVNGSAVPGNLSLSLTKTSNDIAMNFNTNQLADYSGQTLTLNIKMKILPSASLGSDLPNQLTFNNNFKPKGDKVSVKTYGKTFKKIDADTKKPLAGAKFVIKKGDQFMKTVNNEITWVDSQNDATTLISGIDGIITVKGLAQKNDGQNINYQLVETAAPEGYVIAQKSLSFTADDGTIILDVVNKLNGSLPITGGIGLIAFIISGLTIMSSSLFYYLKRRKEFSK